MKATLKPISVAPDEEGVELQGGHLVIGRARDCDYPLESPLVSRHHCELILEGHKLLVRDMGSRNGTFVNGERVRGLRLLRHGDLLYVSACVFQVQILETGLERLRVFLKRAGDAFNRLTHHPADSIKAAPG